MTFRQFWPLYLKAHSQPKTRAVHYTATVIGLGSSLVAALTWQPLYLLGIAAAYALAIGSHAVIEHNNSMIRVNPAWGALADLRMFWMALTGRLQNEIDRCVRPAERAYAREAVLGRRPMARRGRQRRFVRKNLLGEVAEGGGFEPPIGL